MQIHHAFMLTLFLGGLLFIGNVSADSIKSQLEASPRHGEWVKVTTADERVVNTFVVYPEVKEPATAIIVIHEIFGLTDWIRLVADRLAAAGFVAICPDLLSGMGPDGGGTESFDADDDVRRTIRELSPSQVASDLDAIEKYARDLPSTNDKVAVSGFCWGGWSNVQLRRPFRYNRRGFRILRPRRTDRRCPQNISTRVWLLRRER